MEGILLPTYGGYPALIFALESRDFRKREGMCRGLPSRPSLTLWDIPTLSLLGRGEVQTRKPSFGSASGTTYLFLSALPPPPHKSSCFFEYRQLQGEGGKGCLGRGWEASHWIL